MPNDTSLLNLIFCVIPFIVAIFFIGRFSARRRNYDSVGAIVFGSSKSQQESLIEKRERWREQYPDIKHGPFILDDVLDDLIAHDAKIATIIEDSSNE